MGGNQMNRDGVVGTQPPGRGQVLLVPQSARIPRDTRIWISSSLQTERKPPPLLDRLPRWLAAGGAERTIQAPPFPLSARKAKPLPRATPKPHSCGRSPAKPKPELLAVPLSAPLAPPRRNQRRSWCHCLPRPVRPQEVIGLVEPLAQTLSSRRSPR
jgi:hypothetical protein